MRWIYLVSGGILGSRFLGLGILISYCELQLIESVAHILACTFFAFAFLELAFLLAFQFLYEHLHLVGYIHENVDEACHTLLASCIDSIKGLVDLSVL